MAGLCTLSRGRAALPSPALWLSARFLCTYNREDKQTGGASAKGNCGRSSPVCGPGDVSLVAGTPQPVFKSQMLGQSRALRAQLLLWVFLTAEQRSFCVKLAATHGWKGGGDRPREAPAIARLLRQGLPGCRQKFALQTQERVGLALWCSKAHAWGNFLGFVSCPGTEWRKQSR